MTRRFVITLTSLTLLCVCLATEPLSGQSAKVIVPHPSWNCGMPDGIPAPESGSLVFEAQLRIQAVHRLGRTPYGNRQVTVFQDGTFKGPRVSGTVAPGALDLELTLANGVVELEQSLVLATGDGKYVYLRTAGTGADEGTALMVEIGADVVQVVRDGVVVASETDRRETGADLDRVLRRLWED